MFKSSGKAMNKSNRITISQDILLNDDIKLDWTFRLSFATDIARVSSSVGRLSADLVCVEYATSYQEGRLCHWK